MKVTDYIAEFFNVNDIDIVFGYQGSSIAHLIDSLSRNQFIRFVETRHEQAAAFAANGYALAKQKLGVAIACSGPGALNLVSGIADAFYDSIPCLFITGQVSQKEMKQNPKMRQSGFQETDIVSIVSPITKYAVSIKQPEDIIEELQKAVRIALEDRSGSVLIDIPHNIQGAQIDVKKVKRVEFQSKVTASRNELLQIADKFNEASRPIIIIGGGCNTLDRETMRKIGDLYMPIVTSYRGKSVFDNTLDAYCGTLGVYGERSANWAVKYSDLVICLGTRLDGRQTGGESLQLLESENVIIVDIDDNELLKFPSNYMKVRADAALTIRELIDYIDKNDVHKKWLNTIHQWRERYHVESEYKIPEDVNPNLFLKKVSAIAKRDAVFALDVGQNQLWANNSVCIRENQVMLQSGGLGAMGFALPASIGGFFAKKSQTICISGDGGIQMNLQELQTIAAEHIPIKIFILNNNGLGLIRDYQYKALGARYYGSVLGFGSPDYRALAEAYGLYYHRITINQCDEELECIFKDSKACLVEVIVNKLSTAYPEPTYNSTIINQSSVLSEDEKMKVEEEAYGCV